MSTKPRRRIVVESFEKEIFPEDTIYEVSEKYNVGDWREFFSTQEENLKTISAIVEKNEKKHGTFIPGREQLFLAFKKTQLRHLKVIIVAQDPYPNRANAMGLALSTPRDVKVSASMKTVFKEIADNMPNFEIPDHSDLTKWAQQGVLLLNMRLTVHEGLPGKYNNCWEGFTNNLIAYIKEKAPNTLFMLWGGIARKLSTDLEGMNVLEAAHPSPMNQGGGFLGCKHFQKANLYLKSVKQEPIDWNLD